MAKDRRFQSHATKDATLSRRKPITEARKAAHVKENRERAERNAALREQGLPTPHEAQRAKRRAVRDDLRARGELPPIGTPRSEWRGPRRSAS
jgi:hypothetical protein